MTADRRPGPKVPRGAVSITDALGNWRRRHPRRGKLGALRERWKTVAGAWAPMTRPASLHAGILRVEVASSVVLSELANLRKAEFLARMQAAEPSMLDVRFAVGDGPWGQEGEGS